MSKEPVGLTGELSLPTTPTNGHRDAPAARLSAGREVLPECHAADGAPDGEVFVPEALVAGRECPLCSGRGVPLGLKDGHLLRECRCHGPTLLSWAWGCEAEYEAWYRSEEGAYHGPHQATQGLRPMWERDGDFLQAASVRLRILAGLFPGARRVVDIGAGTGAFISLLAAHGWDAVGYEPCPAMVAAAQARGRNLRLGGWADWPGETPPPDLVTLHDVLEHLTQPGLCLRRLRELLGPESVLAVEMPEWDCPLSREQGLRFRHVRPLEHPVLYSEGSAGELLRQSGLRTVALVRPLEGALGKVTFYLKRT